MIRLIHGLLIAGLFGICLFGAFQPLAATSGEGNSRAEFVAEAAGEGEGEGGGHGVFYRWVNFVLLVGGLSVVLRKPLREFFSQRTSSVHKALEEGRQALEASAQRLYAVESRLAHFEEEMATFREKAVQEMAEERERLHRLTAEEGAKMMESVRAQLDTAFKAARLELRLYAAEQAVKLAGARIGESLDEAGHERLVARFVAGLDARKSQN